MLSECLALLVAQKTDCIFVDSDPNISSIDASIITTAMLILANLVFVNVVDRFGRRTFYIYSSLATVIGHVVFGLYLHFLAYNQAFDLVPIIVMSYGLVANAMGMNPVPWVIMMEIFPKKV